MDKILTTIKNYLPVFRGRDFSLVYVMIIAFGILFLLFIGGWAWNLSVTGKADLDALIKFTTTMISPAALAFFTAICKGASDKNNNGVPDLLEEPERPSIRPPIGGKK